MVSLGGGNPVNSTVMRFVPISMNRILLAAIFLCWTTAVSGQASTPTSGCPPVCDFQKFDEIHVLTSREIRVRLDNLVSYLQRGSSDIVVYLIAYAGPRACVGEAYRLNLRAKNYLVTKHRIAPGRLFLTDGGYREAPMLEIWMLPSRVARPEPNPTIDRAQVRLKNCMKRNSMRRRRA